MAWKIWADQEACTAPRSLQRRRRPQKSIGEPSTDSDGSGTRTQSRGKPWTRECSHKGDFEQETCEMGTRRQEDRWPDDDRDGKKQYDLKFSGLRQASSRQSEGPVFADQHIVERVPLHRRISARCIMTRSQCTADLFPSGASS